MATIRVLLDQRKHCRTIDGSFPLVLRIGHNRQNRDISLGIHAQPNQFNADTYEIKGIVNSVRHTKRVKKKYSDIDLWLDEEMETIKHWDINNLKSEIEKKFFDKQSSLTLLGYAAIYLRRLQLENRYSTARSYEDALKKFIKFRMHSLGKKEEVRLNSIYSRNGDHLQLNEEYQQYDLAIKAFDSNFAKDFKAYMANSSMSRNSIGIYLRSLQAILNDAGGSYKELQDHKPLEKIKKTSTRNKPVDLTIGEIDAIRKLKLEETSPLFHARNYFLFMFNNMGMNFFDLALLRTHQFDGENIHYTRKKTEIEGDNFSIKQNEEALNIIRYYGHIDIESGYLFPIIPSDTPPERIYRVKNDKIGWLNKHLKKLAELAGIEKKITSYTPRDTWTNIGLDMGIDIRDISSGLGHSSIEVTDKHYGQSVKQKVLEKINSRITGSNYSPES